MHPRERRVDRSHSGDGRFQEAALKAALVDPNRSLDLRTTAGVVTGKIGENKPQLTREAHNPDDLDDRRFQEAALRSALMGLV